jgi:hypothetical protein
MVTYRQPTRPVYHIVELTEVGQSGNYIPSLVDASGTRQAHGQPQIVVTFAGSSSESNARTDGVD